MKITDTYENNISFSSPLALYHCGHEKCKPSHSYGPAVRPHYLIHYILHGKGKYYVNDSTYSLKEGDGFLITPGITTLYCADEEDPWEYCWIGFDGYDVNAVLQSCGLSYGSLIFTDLSNGLFKKSLLSLIHNFTEGRGNELAYIGQLYLCFSYICRPKDKTSNYIYKAHMAKALEYIQHNYSYDIKISDMAKYLSIDRTYLYKLFLSYKKISPQQYLINYRLSIAQNLLKESDLSVTEIAYSCGFKDASSFNKHFKNHLNITPMQFRTDKDHFRCS
jgi:AraC-like DNA-binding protein